MASFTIQPYPEFTVGATVSLYANTGQRPPLGAALGTATVQANGTTTFTGLAEGAHYIAGVGSPFGGSFRGVEFTTGYDATNPTGAFDARALATDVEVADAISRHAADTTDVHGIADTAPVEGASDWLDSVTFVRDPVAPEVDDTAAWQEAIDAGGTILPRAKDYIVNGGLTVGTEHPVTILGAGRPMGSSTFNGTRLKRTSGTNTVLSVVGGSFSSRARVDIQDLEINGGGLAGMGLVTDRVSDSYFRRLRISGCVHTGWRLKQAYNCTASDVQFASCGNGVTNPVLLFDAFAEGQGGTQIMQWSNVQFVGNSGQEIKLTGNTGSSAPTTQVTFNGLNIEAGVGGTEHAPMIDLDYASGCLFTNTDLNVGSTVRDVPMIQQVGSNAGGANSFANLSVSSAASGSTYWVRHGVGRLNIKGWVANAFYTPTAAVRIDSTVSPGYAQIDTPITALAADKVFSDARAVPEYPKLLTGTKTWDPASVADSAVGSTTVTVTGAALGMLARASFSLAVPAGAILSAAVTAADTVTVTLTNKTGGALDLASGTLRADAFY